MILKYRKLGVEAFVSLSRYLDENFALKFGNYSGDEDAETFFPDISVREGQTWAVLGSNQSWMLCYAPFARLMSSKSYYDNDCGTNLLFDVVIEMPDEVRASVVLDDVIGRKAVWDSAFTFAPNTNDIVPAINDIVAGRTSIT